MSFFRPQPAIWLNVHRTDRQQPVDHTVPAISICLPAYANYSACGLHCMSMLSIQREQPEQREQQQQQLEQITRRNRQHWLNNRLLPHAPMCPPVVWVHCLKNSLACQKFKLFRKL